MLCSNLYKLTRCKQMPRSVVHFYLFDAKSGCVKKKKNAKVFKKIQWGNSISTSYYNQQYAILHKGWEFTLFAVVYGGCKQNDPAMDCTCIFICPSNVMVWFSTLKGETPSQFINREKRTCCYLINVSMSEKESSMRGWRRRPLRPPKKNAAIVVIFIKKWVIR